MEMEGHPEVIPPSGRVLGQRLLIVQILKRRRRRYRAEIRKRLLYFGFPRRGQYIGEGGQPGGPPRAQAPPWRGQILGRATRVPGSLVVALWPHPGVSERFLHADFFILVFPNFCSTFNMGES